MTDAPYQPCCTDTLGMPVPCQHAPVRDAAYWAKKLYDDLAFAAPELWLMKMTLRFEQAMEEAASDAVPWEHEPWQERQPGEE